MLRLIPAPLHRLALRVAHDARKNWWQLAKPRVNSVIVIVRDDAGHVLLVRHTYGRADWTLPGGGIRRGEEPAAAARREFTEELGCELLAIEDAGTHKLILHGARVTRHLFTGEADGTPEPDGREVADARFFARDALPRQCSSIVEKYLALAESEQR
jgi:ADP-ribose pyrophosphatase YjhB (NUDIX family)